MLKDGRIANVSIHVLPFASGQSELAAEPAEYLAKLTRAVGTDCFLTAQVIGHIASNEIAGDDTLNAHRLARSRADAVQASLIGGGLPAKAIASVWDWQFMVREPRATLWVFELTAGEDCEGRQLHGDLVAEAPSTEQGAAAPERVPRPAAAARRPPRRSPARSRHPAAAPRRKQSPVTKRPRSRAAGRQPARGAAGRARRPPRRRRSRAAAEAVLARAGACGQPEHRAPGAANLAEPPPAAATQTPAPAQPAEPPPPRRADPSAAQLAEQTGRGRAGAVAPAQQAEQPPRPHRRTWRQLSRLSSPLRPQRKPRPGSIRWSAGHGRTADGGARRTHSASRDRAAPAATPQSAAKPSTDDGKVENGPEGGLVIVFATNSSYFPSGAAARLRELLAGVNGEKKYQVTLQVAVSGTTQVVGAKSADEAARYNKWLADRRVERVQAWLVKNAGAQALSIKPDTLPTTTRGG